MKLAILLAPCLTALIACSEVGKTSTTEPVAAASAQGSSLADPATFPVSTEGLPEAKAMPIVELKDGDHFTLTAQPVKQKIGDKWIRRLAYNGSVPGPVIKVKQGSKIRVTLKNDTDIPTTLHPHGLRLDYRYDGVVGIGQMQPVAPGQSYDYELTFPDAGMYWYHPHIREDYSQRLGMYGNFWVVPSDPDYYTPVHREVVMLLDDASVKSEAPFYRDRVTHTLMGRYGDLILINGSDDFSLTLAKGEVVRLFITNTANTRTIKFALPGAKMKLIGSDGGLYEKESWVNYVVIAPSERYIVDVRYDAPGAFDILNDIPGKAMKIGRVTADQNAPRSIGDRFTTLRSPPKKVSDLAKVKAKTGIKVTKQLNISLRLNQESNQSGQHSGHHGGQHGGHHGGHQESHHGAHGHTTHATAKGKSPDHGADRGIEWTDEMAAMNQASDDRNLTWLLIDPQTKASNMDINWQFKRGDYVKIRLFNDPSSVHPMQHPIHFHGQRFVVAATNGQPNKNLVWKDSTLVRPGDRVDIVLEASNPGQWMAHCHISEHLHAGMMMGFKVTN